MRHITFITALVAALLFLAVTARCQEIQLPDAPSKVVDRNFVILTGINAGITAADLYTTISPKFHNAACPYEIGSSWLYSREPQKNQARATAIMAGEMAATTFVAYLLKKKQVKVWKFELWTMPLAYESSIHARGALNNFRNCRSVAY